MNAVDKQIKEIRTTAELVIAAQGGDQAAFGLLYERFQPGCVGDRDATTAQHD